MNTGLKDLRIVEEAKKPLSMHPKKFALWLFIASVMMLFGAFTSAYLVKRADTGWAEVKVPDIFWINSVIILLSSFTMGWAHWSAKRNQTEKVKLALFLTLILGIAFLTGQILAYSQMIALNEFFTGGNVSHSFLWVLPGVHGFHIISGLIFLGIVLASAFKLKVHSKNMNQMEMCSTYWHFLDGLWLYLFIFLLLNP